MSFADEFAVVRLVIESGLETRGIDAFALSLIKAERQMRRLFTNLVYQSPAFGLSDIPSLRATLGASKRSYFEGFHRGVDALFDRTIQDLIGPKFDVLHPRISDAISIRNKIFHGQLTDRCLGRPELVEFVTQIRAWCELLSEGAMREAGYDGFRRDSFSKNPINLAARLRLHIENIDAYKRLLDDYVERPPGDRQWRPPAVVGNLRP